VLPGQGGEKAYTLLREALRESGRIGIAKLVMRNEPHLAAVEAIKDAIVLSTMRFREELVPVTAYDFPSSSIRTPELRMAHQLIEGLAADWDPEKYTDEYRANLLEIIEARRRHTKPDLEKQEPEAEAKVVDLMERLRRSLGKAAGSRTRGKTRGPVETPVEEIASEDTTPPNGTSDRDTQACCLTQQVCVDRSQASRPSALKHSKSPRQPRNDDERILGCFATCDASGSRQLRGRRACRARRCVTTHAESGAPRASCSPSSP
jgi:DNA end-binding protein Ku